jgi:hypothetical protein
VVYEKTDRYDQVTGGGDRGKPNEEEVNGVRTWRPLKSPSKSDPYRYYWEHSHTALQGYATRAELYPSQSTPQQDNDQDTYPGFVESYFRFWDRFNDKSETTVASVNRFPYSDMTTAHRKIVKRDFPVGLGYDFAAPVGMFEIYKESLPLKIWVYNPELEAWEIETLPREFLSTYPSRGWPSPPPFYYEQEVPPYYLENNIPFPEPWPEPPENYLKVTTTINQSVGVKHPDQVGLKYSGYLEVLTCQGYWELIETTDPENPPDPTKPENYVYKFGEVTADQHASMSYTVTQQDYIRLIDGDPALLNPQTYEISGGQDVYVSFGYVVLESVTSWAD